MATGILPPGLIAPALRNAVRVETNVRTLLADVYDIDLEGRTVHAIPISAMTTSPSSHLG